MRSRDIAWGMCKSGLAIVDCIRAVVAEDEKTRGTNAEIDHSSRKQVERHLLDAGVAFTRALSVLAQEHRAPLRAVGVNEKPEGAA